MLDPIKRTVEVPCSQEMAFTIFINEMSSWWPLDKFTVSAMSGAPAQSIRVDAKEGGDITEIMSDGTEYLWGTIQTYDPFGNVSLTLHFAPPGYVVTGRTLVEVNFAPLDDRKTRVELVQSNWEALGEQAEMMRGGYGTGWTAIFEQGYAGACEAAAREA